MRATYERTNENGKWIREEIDTDNLDNDSGTEWSESALKYYVIETHQQNQEAVRGFTVEI